MKIPIPLQLAVIAAGMTGFYTMVGQAVPQKEVHPPEVIEMDTGMSTAELVEIGKGIFEGKGICVTCHTIGKSGALRFPDLDDIANRAAKERPGYTALDYLAESMYEPDIYIVPGFSPGMPTINKPPIGLTDQEVISVIAYLQTLGGEPTVTLEPQFVYTGGTREGAPGGSDAGADDTLVAEAGTAASDDGLASTPLGTFGCVPCHGTSAGSLSAFGATHDSGAIFLRLSDHDTLSNQAEDRLGTLTLDELTTLVRFLADAKGEA